MTDKHLVIDYRENTLINLLQDKYPDLSFITENLPVGDIFLRLDDKPLFIIERKTISDLVSSIKDGRYREQKARLKQTVPDNRILYLIEGKLPSIDCDQINRVSYKSVYGSLIHTMVRDGNFVYRTDSIAESAFFISDLVTRWKNLKDPWFTENSTNISISTTQKIRKKGDISTSVCFECQLSQIPSISVNKARIISCQYPNMRSFCQWISETSTEQRPQVLANLSMTNSDNKTKKIGKASAQKILNFLGYLEN